MEVTKETLGILVFLIPGFISVLVYNKLIYRGQIEAFNKVIEALIYSLLIYFGTIILTGEFPINVSIFKGTTSTDYSWEYNKISIFSVLFLSILYPVALGYLNRYDLLHRFFRTIKATNRTGRESIWLDVMYDIKTAVIVHMKDGRRLFGWPQYFSNNIGPGFLYLVHAAWIDNDGKYLDLNINGLFLVDHETVAHIEFLKKQLEGEKNG